MGCVKQNDGNQKLDINKSNKNAGIYKSNLLLICKTFAVSINV